MIFTMLKIELEAKLQRLEKLFLKGMKLIMKLLMSIIEKFLQLKALRVNMKINIKMKIT